MRIASSAFLVGTALVAGVTCARADIVRLDDFTYGPASTVTVASPAYTGQAGQFKGTLNGDAFFTFCTDLLQSFYLGATYTDYRVVSGVSAFGAAKSLDLDRTMTALLAPGTVHDAASSAAAQAMIWEVLYETDGSYDLTRGTFRASGSGAPVQAALDAMTWSRFAATPIRYHVDRLFSPTAQDFLVVSAVDATVPEPSGLALVAAAMTGLALVRRKVKADAAA